MGLNDPSAGVVEEVRLAHERARGEIEAFDPDLVVMFAPDHYNGFHYNVMPPFCIGTQALSIGDYGLPKGPLLTNREAALRIIEQVHASGVDAAVSEDMHVDHGLVQPLMLLFGALDHIPVVPIFINCVAEPLVSASRIVALGQAVGRAVQAAGLRVVFLGSGGLSHDPPVPTLAGAAPPVRERLLGRSPTSVKDRQVRENGTVAAARAFAGGTSSLRELNPGWDAQVMSDLARGDLAAVAEQPNEWFIEHGGHSAHEVRTWIAAYAALGVYGTVEVTGSFYAPVREWLAGFGVTTAEVCPPALLPGSHPDGKR